jgi:hypothetical protein
MFDFVGKKKQNKRVSTLLGAKGLRWLRWLRNLVLKIKLKWLQGCQ